MFTKISDKLYKVELDGVEKEIFVPFAKANQILTAFLESGAVNEDLSINEFVLISSFERIANILLTEYDENGKLVKEGSCTGLSYSDTVKLIALGVDAFGNFSQALSLLSKTAEEVKATTKDSKKTKKDTQ